MSNLLVYNTAFRVVLILQLVILTVLGCATESTPKLLFQEDFESMTNWKHVVTAYRMDENQFQYYSRRRENSFIKDGKLFIKPTLTSDRFGEAFLHQGKYNLKKEGCNLSLGGTGCILEAGKDIANPIQSAALVSKTSFSFTYGTVVIRAKMPRGDWIWPEISLMPAQNVYGEWPRSGYIGLAEIRGNDNFFCHGKPMGNRFMEALLEWGIDSNHTKSLTWAKEMPNNTNFPSHFRTYRLEWTPKKIHIFVDDELVGAMNSSEVDRFRDGFNSTVNPWVNGTIMAPFDQKFFIAVNVAVGGSFFPDECDNFPYPKPWNNSSPATAMSSFWREKDRWYPTWSQSSTDDSALQIDYIHVYDNEK